MKQTLTLLLAFLALGCAMSQDIIYTTDGQAIEARNLKIEGNSLWYNLYSASIMDRSTYIIDLSRVSKIKYEDGRVSKIMLEDRANSNEEKTEPAVTPAPKAAPQVQTNNSGTRDTVIAYAIVQPNKQLSPKLYNAYPPYKSPALAFASSLLVPGLGQLYNDQLTKGFLFMAGDLMSVGLSAITFTKGESMGGYFFMATAAIVRIAAAIEASIEADALNNGHGYIALSPTLQQTHLAFDAGSPKLVPGMAMSLSF